MLLSLVVPAYNEEENVALFYSEVKKVFENKVENYEIVFVDDGSKDRTWEIICQIAKEDSKVEGITLSRNRGHQNAVLAGLMEVKDRCDITITIDCDGVCGRNRP